MRPILNRTASPSFVSCTSDIFISKIIPETNPYNKTVLIMAQGMFMTLSSYDYTVLGSFGWHNNSIGFRSCFEWNHISNLCGEIPGTIITAG